LNKEPFQFLSSFAALLCGFHVAGCACSIKCGDARLVHTPAFLLAVEDYLSFPKVPVGRRASFVWRVENLPHPIYPHEFELEIPESEVSRDRHDQPWRSTILYASLVREDGVPFYERTIDFAKDWNGNSGPGKTRSTRRISLFFTHSRYTPRPIHLPNRTSYVFHVKVVRPSGRPSDTLEIEALDDSFDRISAAR
jgi:hypothetical protein